MIKATELISSVSRNAGGLYECVRRLVQSLANDGMDIRVLGGRDEFTDADVGAWKPVRVYPFNPIGPKNFGYSPRFLEALREFQPDIVHSHGLWLYPSVATESYCRKFQRPYVVSAHGMLDPWAVRNSRWKKVIAHFLFEGSHLRRARCLHALCESEARAMRKFKLENEIAIIPNGIELPSAAPTGLPPWDKVVESGRKVLLLLGRIHPKKGIPSLLKAWAHIQSLEKRGQRSEEWVLAIAGWDQGGHETELKRLATKLGLVWTDIRDQKVEPRNQLSAFSLVFLGPQFGVAKEACYAHCDGFILPSFSEGLPTVILEAWARAKPAVMTPECNLPEGFAAGAALRIDPDTESVTMGLEEFFGMTEAERAAMGSRGRSLVADRFAWPRISQQMIEVYQWILGGGQRPCCLADF